MEILLCSFNRERRGGRILHCNTKSRHMGESPAMLPRAQTAYGDKNTSLVSINGAKIPLFHTLETPYLLAHVGNRITQEFNKDGDSASFNHNLSLLRRTWSDIGESPCSLELSITETKSQSPRVMSTQRDPVGGRLFSYLNQWVRRFQELDKFGNDAAGNDLFNRRIAFLGEQLSEFGGSVQLLLNVAWIHTSDHWGKNLAKLQVDRLIDDTMI